MDLADFGERATALDGVRRRTVGGVARWVLAGRLVARELGLTVWASPMTRTPAVRRTTRFWCPPLGCAVSSPFPAAAPWP